MLVIELFYEGLGFEVVAELRVIVASDKVSDAEAEKISAEAAKCIQEEMTYPGQMA